MSAERSKPFFMMSDGQQIFALHYPLVKPSREAIIICQPAPQETMRSQAALGQLARRLQEDGRTVVRFDYSGTGDSEGAMDCLCLDQWLQDLLKVCAWTREHTGCERISLLGLRLGAALAIQASAQIDIHRLILWDPLVDGLDYLRDMEISHARMFNEIEAPFASQRYGQNQCWGFPWTDSWRSQLAAISPALLKPKARHTHIILSAIDPRVRDVSESWEKAGVVLDVQHVGEPMHWGDERYLKIQAFPVAHLRRIQALWEVQADD